MQHGSKQTGTITDRRHGRGNVTTPVTDTKRTMGNMNSTHYIRSQVRGTSVLKIQPKLKQEAESLDIVLHLR